jgi:hypothetical protein
MVASLRVVRVKVDLFQLYIDAFLILIDYARHSCIPGTEALDYVQFARSVETCRQGDHSQHHGPNHAYAHQSADKTHISCERLFVSGNED